MKPPPIRVYFDFVDPLSYVASTALASWLEGRNDMAMDWVGFELRPASLPLTGSDDPFWADRWEDGRHRAERAGLAFAPPNLVPWSAKAHELHLIAAAQGLDRSVRSSIFDAFFSRGLDIGRVDVLVEIGSESGLDRTETKAALDVDRYRADVVEARRAAAAAGVSDVPRLSIRGRLVEGFPDPADLGTLLPDS